MDEEGKRSLFYYVGAMQLQTCDAQDSVQIPGRPPDTAVSAILIIGHRYAGKVFAPHRP